MKKITIILLLFMTVLSVYGQKDSTLIGGLWVKRSNTALGLWNRNPSIKPIVFNNYGGIFEKIMEDTIAVVIVIDVAALVKHATQGTKTKKQAEAKAQKWLLEMTRQISIVIAKIESNSTDIAVMFIYDITLPANSPMLAQYQGEIVRSLRGTDKLETDVLEIIQKILLLHLTHLPDVGGGIFKK